MEGCRVLLVDDEREFAATLAERLNLRGIQAQVVNCGADALQTIAHDTPQIVILDLMMPGMNGLDVLKHIKSDYPDVQVIVLTGMGSSKDGLEGMRLGAFDFMMKPLQIEELIQKIRDAFSVRAREGKVE
jgi:DNA-binding NtrC family response regulator